MNFPTSNVIVSFQREPMDKLFASDGKGTNLADVLTGNKSEDFMVFNHEGNPNFISFSYQFGFGGGDHTAKLELIDPNNEFERRYLNQSVVDLIAGGGGAHSTKDKMLNEPTRNSPEDSVLRDAFHKRYNAAAQARTLWVSFGSGNNLDTWAGPYQMYIQSINVDVRQSRKLTITMVPTPMGLLPGDRKGAYNEFVNLSLRGLTKRYHGKSLPLNFNIPKDKLTPSTGWSEIYGGYQSKFEDLGVVRKAFAKESKKAFDQQSETYFSAAEQIFGTQGLARIDFHSIIVDCIRNYLGKVTQNPNIIVLLPNLNTLMWSVVQQVAYQLRQEPDPNGAGPAMGSFAYDIKSLYNLRIDDWNYKTLAFDLIRGVLEKVGLKLIVTDKEAANPNKAIESLPAAYEQSINSRYLPGANNFSTEESLENFFGERYEWTASLVSTGTGTVHDHKEVLWKFLDKLQSVMVSNYSMERVCFSENSEKVLNQWYIRRDNPTFGGYRYEWQEGKEAIIFGDMGLISNYLYGKRLQEDEEKLNKIEAGFTKTIGEYNEAIEKLQPEGDENKEEILKIQKQRDNFVYQTQRLLPLHPADRVSLNTAYQKQIRKALFKKDADMSTPFGDVYDVPDEFSYSDLALNEKAKKQIIRDKFPVFRYNTQNPNVLDLTSNIGETYWSTLVQSYSKKVDRQATAITEGMIGSGFGYFSIRSIQAAKGFLQLKNYSQANEDKQSEIVQELKKNLDQAAVDEYADWYAALEEAAAQETASGSFSQDANYALLDVPHPDEGEGIDGVVFAAQGMIEAQQSNPFKGEIMVDQELPGNPTDIMIGLIADAHRKAYQVKLKTLPLFHLSERGNTIMNACILFAQDAQVLKGTKQNAGYLNALFTGVYLILGYKHTISANGEASSEFALVPGLPPAL